HCGERSDELHGTHRAAEARMSAELNFWEAERDAWIVGAHAVPARECHFEPTSECEAVDRGDGRAGEGGEAIEDLLTAADHLEGLIGALNREELFDIGAGNETLLGRAHDDR